MKKIKRALLSVYKKDGIVELAKFLDNLDIQIISTGGTAKIIEQSGISVTKVSQITDFPEIMDGRVKTLHPRIFGGLLCDTKNVEHLKQAQKHNIKEIDLVVVNLYPFRETVKQTSDVSEIINKIDIGGPTMVRATAKNYSCKTIISNTEDYERLKFQLEKNKGCTSFEFRKEMAEKAFCLVADYNIAIANWFMSQNKNEGFLNKRLYVSYPSAIKLRYGENPNQRALFYNVSDMGLKQIQGKELSYNNINDLNSAIELIKEFQEPTAVFIKHTNACGVASRKNIDEAFSGGLKTDSKSAFGGVIAINRSITKNIAEFLVQNFFELIVAPEVEIGAKAILAKRKNLRVLIGEMELDNYEFKTVLNGGLLVQEKDLNEVSINNDLEVSSDENIKKEIMVQIIFGIKVCKHLKSNSIVVVDNFTTIGIGCGQTNRVASVELACEKAKEKITSNSVLVSDGFFPFSDSVLLSKKYGIKYIVAPSGSINDKKVAEEAKENNIKLIFTKKRYFRH
ncbi:bifunctional phosphoribosylaminoimidazolecarboxamide formyltransferase/IMP cyclohydrolase [Pseudomonadota bacterium]